MAAVQAALAHRLDDAEDDDDDHGEGGGVIASRRHYQPDDALSPSGSLQEENGTVNSGTALAQPPASQVS